VNCLSDILREKGNRVLRIDGGASVFEAIQQMVERNVGALLITEDDGTTGILTERDYLRRVTLEGRTDKETLVREIMTTPVICLPPETSVDECMALMTEKRFRHAPVVEDGEIVGMISIGDLVKYHSKQQSAQIQYFTDYITSR
jgi:CBS domain-containing protein